jgi:hypothetical protein
VRLTGTIAQKEAELTRVSAMTLAEVKQPDQELPAPLLGQKFPAIFVVESQYRLALLKAELDFVDDLVRNITEEGWGPVGLWRDIQATCELEYQRENEAAPQDVVARVAGAEAGKGQR